MYIAIYEMKIKPGFEKQFEEYWAKWTEAIYRCRGSLGSRLHRTKESDRYIAYAQWPSKEVYDDTKEEPFTKDELTSRDRMRESTTSIKTIELLEVLTDLLKSKTYLENKG